MTTPTMLLLATLLILSSNSFWSLWVSLELFSFLLMPWLVEGAAKTSKVSIFFYFLMQFVASVGFLVSSLSFYNSMCFVVMFSSVLMKMSCFPFHSWFVDISPAVSWEKLIVLMTLSKVVPLAMLALLMPPKGFIWILVAGLLPVLGGFSTTCLRKIMAYSSVGHSSWLVICCCLDKTTSVLYIISYFSVLIPVCLAFMMENVTSMKGTLSSKGNVLWFVVSLMALSGIPPFLGFVPKLMVVQELVFSGACVEAAAIGVLSILPLYFYLKIGMLVLGMKVVPEFPPISNWEVLTSVMLGVGAVSLVLLMLSFSL